MSPRILEVLLAANLSSEGRLVGEEQLNSDFFFLFIIRVKACHLACSQRMQALDRDSKIGRGKTFQMQALES